MMPMLEPIASSSRPSDESSFTVADYDDMFGPPHSYPTAYPPRNRPSMISAQYRLKEERRKWLKISQSKLKMIDDPELNLCRSVLINNITRRLRRELDSPSSGGGRHVSAPVQPTAVPSEASYPAGTSSVSTPSSSSSSSMRQVLDRKHLALDNMLDEGVVDMDTLSAFIESSSSNSSSGGGGGDASSETATTPVVAPATPAVKCSLEEMLEECVAVQTPSKQTFEEMLEECATGPAVASSSSNKRTFEEMLDECDMSEVLSQFYLQPTPRLLTAIDDDEDINVVDDEQLIKRLRIENDSLNIKEGDYTAFLNHNITTTSRLTASCVMDSSDALSCGQASMFGELQTSAFLTNFITSLET